MYLNHFNLREKPFNISPDSRFLWLSEKHNEGLATLKYAILEEKGFLLLTGDVGTGKTLLIRAFTHMRDIESLIATIPDPDLDIMDFFKLLAEEFEMDPSSLQDRFKVVKQSRESEITTIKIINLSILSFNPSIPQF